MGEGPSKQNPTVLTTVLPIRIQRPILCKTKNKSVDRDQIRPNGRIALRKKCSSVHESFVFFLIFFRVRLQFSVVFTVYYEKQVLLALTPSQSFMPHSVNLIRFLLEEEF